MAWTQAEIDTLKAAIATGVLTVRHLDGRSFTYQSIDDMLKALAVMESEVLGGDGGSRTTYASTTRD